MAEAHIGQMLSSPSRSLPSAGPSWDAAIIYGIDVTLIERNLQLSVSERLLQLDDMVNTYYALRPPSRG